MATGVILFMSCKTLKKEELPMAESTMPGMGVIGKQLVEADGDLLRELVSGVVQASMSAEAGRGLALSGALVSVVADLYLAGVSTRRVDKVVRQLGIQGMSRSQVSRLAAGLGELVEGFPHPPLDAGPFPSLMLDAWVVKVRRGGRIVNVCVCHATAVKRRG